MVVHADQDRRKCGGTELIIGLAGWPSPLRSFPETTLACFVARSHGPSVVKLALLQMCNFDSADYGYSY